MAAPLLLVFFFGFPALTIFLSEKCEPVNRVGAVIICYLAGIALGNAGIVPETAARLQDPVTSVAIPLALPLMFFSLDFRQWLRLGKRAIVSFAFMILSVTAVTVCGHFIFRAGEPSGAWKVSGMLVGVYTGGTVNLASIGTALGVEPSLYVATHTSDILVSAIYLLFVMSIAKRLFLGILRPFTPERAEGIEVRFNDYRSYAGIFAKERILPLLVAFGLAALIAAVGGGVSLLLPKEIGTVAAILIFTTLGILCSTIPAVRRIRMTYQLGQYFILVFCLAIGSMADVRVFASAAPFVVEYVAFVVFGSLLVHLSLARIFRMDADTTIITSVAGICSPPFVPMVAASLGNRQAIFSGVVTGIIGWVVGTYLGIGVAYLLR